VLAFPKISRIIRTYLPLSLTLWSATIKCTHL